jgi:hypothetical protein
MATLDVQQPSVRGNDALDKNRNSPLAKAQTGPGPEVVENG